MEMVVYLFMFIVKVALVGSGATTVTLLPNIADTVKTVTMVQRTPTYIAALPRVGIIDCQFYIFHPLFRWMQSQNF